MKARLNLINNSAADHSKRTHVVRVDVLRGVAILTVFVFHFIGAIYGWDWWRWNGNWRNFDVPYRPFTYVFYPLTLGWTGVSLFFVISGFVIHLSYLNSRNFNLRAFFWRRFWRIYPAYLVALICFTWFTQVNIFTKTGASDFLSHALLIHNLDSTTFFSINGSFWSLGLEAQFYALYPLLLFIRHKIGINQTLLFTFALSVVSRLFIMLFTDCAYPVTAAWTFPTVLWFDWVLGAFVAESFFAKKRAFNFSFLQITALIAAFFLMTLYQPTNAFSFSAASFLSAVLLDKYIHREKVLGFTERMLIPIGLCSYSLYLWHQPLINPLLNKISTLLSITDDRWTLALSIIPTFILILCGAWISYILVEKPSLRIVKKLSRNV